MIITLYGHRKQSHNYLNDISEFSYKNGSEWYITSDTSIKFSQVDGNYYIWQ
jgi:hypothetical protein